MTEGGSMQVGITDVYGQTRLGHVLEVYMAGGKWARLHVKYETEDGSLTQWVGLNDLVAVSKVVNAGVHYAGS